MGAEKRAAVTCLLAVREGESGKGRSLELDSLPTDAGSFRSFVRMGK
jgi:hypothetical protein